jgi:hypothetical protein
MHFLPLCILFHKPEVGVCITVCFIQMSEMTKTVSLVQQLIDGRPNTVYLSVREKSEEIPILIAESFGAIGEKKENLKGLSFFRPSCFLSLIHSFYSISFIEFYIFCLDLALGTITGLIKSALLQIYEKRQSTPAEQKFLCPGPHSHLFFLPLLLSFSFFVDHWVEQFLL